MRPLAFLSGLLLVTLALAPAPSTRAEEKKSARTLGNIERLDPAFDNLIGRDAQLEILVGDHVWTEGPVWVRKGGYLLFSDIPRNSVYQWKPGKGQSLYLKPSGYTGTGRDLKEPGSNGLLLDPDGNLILMQHGDRRVALLTSHKDNKGKFKTLADRYKGAPLNSPNDGAYKSNGDLYFTDPPYGLKRKDWKEGDKDEFPGMEMDFCGVWRL